MTDEQIKARELVSVYEGADRLTDWDMDGTTLVLTTDTGVTYRISPDGEQIIRGDGFTTDPTELTERLVNPAAFAPDEFNDPPDVPVSEIPGAVSDFHSDREAELRAMGLADDEDRDYWRAIEGAY